MTVIEFPGPEDPFQRIIYLAERDITRLRDPNFYLGRLENECFNLSLINHWGINYKYKSLVVDRHDISLSFGFLSPLFQWPVARVISEPKCAEEEHDQVVARDRYKIYLVDRGFAPENTYADYHANAEEQSSAKNNFMRFSLLLQEGITEEQRYTASHFKNTKKEAQDYGVVRSSHTSATIEIPRQIAFQKREKQ